MKTPLISIIIPVYNVAPFLHRCLDSVLHQTYPNLEIILIDDGSTDNSPAICDEYASEYSNIRTIHKANGGVSIARNLGINEAKGEYISFIDSDDTVEPKMIEVMYNNAISRNVLLSCCQLDVIDIDDTYRKLDKGRIGLYTKDEILKCYFTNQFIKDQMYGPVNKLIHKSLLKTIYFKPYRLGEDILFIFELLQKCDKVYIDELRGYHYIHRAGSAMTSSFSEKKLDYIYAGEEMIQISRKECPYLTPAVEVWLYRHVIVTLRQINMFNLKRKYKTFYIEKKNYLIKQRKKMKYMSLARKVDFYGIVYFPLYFRIIKLFKK